MPEEIYDVLPLPVHLGGIIDREHHEIKPFIGIYVPIELLEKMGWTDKTPLTLSVEDGYLKIFNHFEEEEKIPGRLEYVSLEDIE
jgi:hypothetical protein